MAFEGIGIDWTFEAGSDLSTKQYRVVALATDGQVDAATQAVNTLDQLGILQDAPSAKGQACQVRLLGISKAVAAGAINPGAAVMANADGDVIACTDASIAIGIHVGAVAAADNDIIPVLLLGPAQAQV